MLDFTGSVVIVTGAGRGIGRAHALLLGARGASVVVNDLGGDTDGNVPSDDPAQRVAAEIEAAGGTALANSDSIADPKGVESLVEQTIERFGRIDGVVNNAGIYRLGRFEDLEPEVFHDFIDVHYLGTLMLCRAAWPHLAASGSGRIVNTVSAAMTGQPDMAHYGAAKGAVYGLTRTLAVAGAAHGIKVNAVAPGAATRMLELARPSLPPGTVEWMQAEMPPEKVSPVVTYLVHPDCAITGEVINAAGGFISRMVMVNTPGIQDPEATPESVAARIGEITDPANAQIAELAFPT
ncbi:SDR family NAD(P)-dependent oxidoreductase [Actinomadura rudentiformis]|uniref:SDR family NAD(P)-dependent oxidoreductase n=1 Tax=Actinomadura rudentiformis TaxID=359158 RepID=A0A6H9YJL8_9ACTN|nr:SDR family NAD(P)-dependent oxidoreductase [Actinomadura rudentiformis]KAB2341565.1 SDR family NAD(P)-dependent oxidoreductase [Actinomadura rudentiformis]